MTLARSAQSLSGPLVLTAVLLAVAGCSASNGDAAPTGSAATTAAAASAAAAATPGAGPASAAQPGPAAPPQATFRPGSVAPPPQTVNPDQLAQQVSGLFQQQLSAPPESLNCPPLRTVVGSAVDCTAVRAATTYVVHVVVRGGQGWQTDLDITIKPR